MPLLTLVIILCALGFGLWALNTYAPLDGKIKQVINVVVVLVAVIFAAQAFGVCGNLGHVQVPQIR
jgi:hypothetical protein